MASIVLFHHVRGLTDGVRAFAERLSERGHEVCTPDYFEGRTFAAIDEGIAYARGVGFGAIRERAIAAAADAPRAAVFAGMSLGVMPAQTMLLSLPQARAGVLLHGFTPPEEMGLEWRDDIPVQIHAMDADPWVVDDGDLDAARSVQSVHGNLEVHTYPGSGHLFTDETDVDYDAEKTALVIGRVCEMLDSLEGDG